MIDHALSRELRRVVFFAAMVGALGWFTIVVGVIGGIAIAVQSSDTTDILGSSSSSHPYVAVGIGVIVTSLVFGGTMLLADHVARAYALRQEHDLVDEGIVEEAE